jgi:hypothetical protein
MQPHLYGTQVPPQYAHLPRVWFLRNPWDWWVSLWNHWHVRFWNRANQFQKPREQWVRAAVWWARALEPFGPARTPEGLAGAVRLYASMMETQTTIHRKCKATGDACSWGRFENLRYDATRLLAQHARLPPQLRTTLRTLAPRNVTEHAHYRTYYTEPLRDFVAEREQEIIELMGYKF